MTPGERMQAFIDHHNEAMPAQAARLLVRWAIGFSDADAAEEMGIAEQTARKHGHSARQHAVPPDFEPTRDNAMVWAWLHRRCCLTREWNALELPNWE